MDFLKITNVTELEKTNQESITPNVKKVINRVLKGAAKSKSTGAETGAAPKIETPNAGMPNVQSLTDHFEGLTGGLTTRAAGTVGAVAEGLTGAGAQTMTSETQTTTSTQNLARYDLVMDGNTTTEVIKIEKIDAADLADLGMKAQGTV